MKKCLLASVLVLGLSTCVFAATDPTADWLSTDVDLQSVQIVTSNIIDGLPETAHLGVKVRSGSQLPGLLLVDVDIDNDTATGGGSVVTGIPTTLCGDPAQPCKADVGGGFDFTITLVLRRQLDGTSISNCNGCSGGTTNCATRGPQYTCTEGTCYELGQSCSVGDPGCYISENACSNCPGGVFAYPLDQVCAQQDVSCSRGYWTGEWRVGFSQSGQIMNGNINLPMAYDNKGNESICVELPWNMIVTAAYTRILAAAKADHPVFNIQTALANATAGVKFQATAFYNQFYTSTPTTRGTDFTRPAINCTPSGFCLGVTDWLPDTARVATGEYNANLACGHNTAGPYGDVNVDAADVTDFLAEFGRSVFNKPCPTCKSN